MTFVLLLCVIIYFRNQSKRAHNLILKPQSFQVLKIEDQVIQLQMNVILQKFRLGQDSNSLPYIQLGLGHYEFIIYLGDCTNVNEIFHILYEKSYNYTFITVMFIKSLYAPHPPPPRPPSSHAHANTCLL